jgi:hypothetical protein
VNAPTLLEFTELAAGAEVPARCDSLTNCTCAECPIPFLTIGTAEHPDGEPT